MCYNRFMKKHILFFFSLLVVFSFASCTGKPASPDSDIVILYTNDVHCGVDENIGYPGLALYKKEMLEQTPYVTLVDAGDAVQGGIIGLFSHGSYIITLMNELGYEVAVPGNHEFDYGMDRFKELSRMLKCGYISCNFRDKTGKLIFPAYKMLSFGKKKVAFVGICTPETKTKSTPHIFQDENENFIYSFGGEDKGRVMYEEVQEAIDAARKKGADYVILVGHLGERGVTKEWNSISVLSHISGADAVIDGHSHEVTPSLLTADKTGKKIPVTQSGTKLANIGKVTIAKDGTIKTELISSVPEKDGLKEDTSVAKTIADMKKEYSARFEKVIATVDFDLLATDANKSWLVRHEETNLSDLFTDAMKEVLGTDICLLNAGSLRTNIESGEVSLGDIYDVYPFENFACAYEISGQTILDELEFGAKMMPGNDGGFLQTSGLTYKVNTSLPCGAQMNEDELFTGEVKGPYRVHDVMINGEKLDVTKTYTVASFDYAIKLNGDGHLFKGAKRISGGDKIAFDIFREYITSLAEKNDGKIPEIYRESQKRLVVEK